MREPSTIDIQAAQKAAAEQFKSFVGGMDYVKSSDDVHKAQENIAKMFDLFTEGILSEKGAESAHILRILTSQIGSKVLDIFNDSNAVARIANLMKKHQAAAKSNQNALASGTTKKIASGNYNPDDYDFSQVILDFADELQNDILQTRINLSREYEQLKIQRAKSAEGQMEDIQTLTSELMEQDKAIEWQLGAMDADQNAWNASKMKEIEGLMGLFSEEGQRSAAKYNPERIIKQIDSVSSSAPAKVPQGKQTPDSKMGDIDKNLKKLDQTLGDIESGFSKREKALNQREKALKKGEAQMAKGVGGQQGKPDAAKAAAQKKPAGRPLAPPKPAVPPSSGKTGTNITQSGVLNTLSTISTNLGMLVKDNKFIANFKLQYLQIQKQIHKELNKSQKMEMSAAKDMQDTEKNIDKIRKGRSSNFIIDFLKRGGVASIAFTVLGAIFLVGVIRLQMEKFKNEYMPKTDAENMVIFGIEIPGSGQMKNLGVGVRNWIMVGLPNLTTKIKLFAGGIAKRLFGRDSPLRNQRRFMNMMQKIFWSMAIGWAKRASGAVIDAIMGVINIFFPGVGGLAKFLIMLVPSVISFITTQIMLAKKDADLESGMKFDQARKIQSMMGAKLVKSVNRRLLDFTSKVKPIVPAEAMPGMETVLTRNKAGQQGPEKKAIMQVVARQHRGTAQDAVEIQKHQSVNDIQKAAKKDKEAWTAARPGSFYAKVLDGVTNAYAKATGRQGQNGGPDSAVVDANRRHLESAVMPFISSIDAYMDRIAEVRKKRFLNPDNLPLYDIEKGWNPVYRITSADLRTALPYTPFEGIHPKEDIVFGRPVDPEVDSKGYMPFTWIQGNARIAIDPWGYKWWRAKAIRDNVLGAIISGGPYANWGVYGWKNRGFPKLTKKWRQYAQATRVDYGVERDSIDYGNRFVNFINAYRRGQAKEEDNTLESLQDSAADRKFVGMSVDSIRLHGAYFKEFEERRVTQEYGAGLRKADAKDRMDRIGRSSRFGIRYSDLRELMFKLVLPHLQDRATMTGTVSVANSIVEMMIGLGILKKSRSLMDPGGTKEAAGATPIDHFVATFLNTTNFNWEWNRIKGDEGLKTGVSQMLLMYLRNEVIPQWNVVERILPSLFQNQAANRRVFDQEYVALARMFLPESISQFISRHLRFPAAVVKVWDYSNSGGPNGPAVSRREKLDKYRRLAGIPIPSQKEKHVQHIRSKWGKWGQMADAELDKEIESFEKWFKGAAYEAKWTGDHAYEAAVGDYLVQLMSERDRRKGTSDATSLAPSTDLPSLQPPKSMEEVEAERRKKEQEEYEREQEEKRRQREEDERKLKEETEKKRRLAIAQAKIKAMEAIRQQEKKYEEILDKMVQDPAKVAELELKQLGDDVANLKQEAENRIAQLPREQREMKLALIRGDKISAKTFTELKNTAVGLHGNLQSYMEEVKKIPVGSLVGVNNDNGQGWQIQMQDSDAVDLAS